MFAVNGAGVGVWIAQIPYVQDRFDLAKSTLGLILLSLSIGVICAMPLMGQAIVRLGSTRSTRLGGIALCLVVPLPLLAPEPWLLPIALLALGAASGMMDVSMNAHGVALEEELGRPILSSLHAGWSFGGFAGAAAVGAATGLGVDPRVQNAVAGVFLLGLLLFVMTRLGPGSARAEAGGLRLPPRPVLLLAFLCFLIMLTEGAMADWSGVYLRGDLGADAGLAALAFAAFAAGMTAGRLTGDAINRRIGATRLLRGGSALAAIAIGTILLAAQPAVALAGLVAGRRRCRQRRAAAVQRGRPGRRRGVRARDRGGQLDGLDRLPRRPAVHRVPRRGDEPAARARDALSRDRRGRRAGRAGVHARAAAVSEPAFG